MKCTDTGEGIYWQRGDDGCTSFDFFSEGEAYRWAGQALRTCSGAGTDTATCADRVAAAIMEAYRLGRDNRHEYDNAANHRLAKAAQLLPVRVNLPC